MAIGKILGNCLSLVYEIVKDINNVRKNSKYLPKGN
jgi:hypothetical protein